MSITLILVVITVLTSIAAFRDEQLFGKMLFLPYDVNRFGQYYRFLTSGFIHANWMHLGFNMYVLYIFGMFVELRFIELFGFAGAYFYLLMYLLAIVIAEIRSYFKHRHSGEYASLGASGAVSAVVFSAILFNPTGSIGIIFFPVTIPAIAFGLLYLAYSAYMSKYGSDNIAHSAHFYGAIFGLVFPGIIRPALFVEFFTHLVNFF